MAFTRAGGISASHISQVRFSSVVASVVVSESLVVVSFVVAGDFMASFSQFGWVPAIRGCIMGKARDKSRTA
jgi:hypothetical protein